MFFTYEHTLPSGVLVTHWVVNQITAWPTQGKVECELKGYLDAEKFGLGSEAVITHFVRFEMSPENQTLMAAFQEVLTHAQAALELYFNPPVEEAPVQEEEVQG